MNIAGNAEDRSIFVDGQELFPGPSLEKFRHSPDGFNWGYHGSGPAQLALALTMKAAERLNVPLEALWPWYQEVKAEYVATWPQGHDFDVDADIEGFLQRKLDGVAP